ncbi:MAG: hypothetical protein DRG31_07040 [Deltaproteobacteria bacterium]|nr:MAG: hypothetical protein DRG31_07040 [Deltaproteobacteria bacterium]
MSERKRMALEIASSVIGLMVSIILTIFGALVTWDYYVRSIYNPSATELPLVPVIAVIPLVPFCFRWSSAQRS